MIRRGVRQVVLGSIRVVGATAERLSEVSAAVLWQLGAGDRAEELRAGDPAAGVGESDEPAPLSALVAQVRDILDLPGGDGPEDEERERTEREELRRRFSELLDRSRAARPVDGEVHPAFSRIIEEISPDEARIIRFLHEEGPQPVVDVVSTPWVGSGGQTLLDHVSMIGDRAGCHRPDRTATYLDNLSRLGVVRIDDEEIVGHDDYELIEARPEVARAEERAQDELNQRAVLEHVSARLGALGEEFCAVCLTGEGGEDLLGR